MTLKTVGQTAVAKWCSVTALTLSGWIHRRNDYPSPDAEIETEQRVLRGWLPERKAEWKKYAEIRANAPGALLAAQRPHRKKE